MEAKKLIERQQLYNKKGRLTEDEVKTLVEDWHKQREEDSISHETLDRETRSMEKALEKYNVEQLGDIPTEREDGAIRILVCQMGGLASKEVREIKIAATERLIKKYDVNVCVFMEVNFNWSKVNSSANLASWFNEEREVRSVTAHNTTEPNIIFSKYQPGGTGIIVRHECIQYAKRPSTDSSGLGRWCSWPFFANPKHVTRIVVAYRPGSAKSKGLKTVYQQHLRYMQRNGKLGTPIQMFDRDLTEQIKCWRSTGERVVLLMDVNADPLRNNLYNNIRKGPEGMQEFTHTCWGPTPPHTYARGSGPIDGGYKSPEIEITNLSMLTFADSPGDHRSLLLDISTRSMIGDHLNKICRPVSRRLVTAQQSSVNKYNDIVQDQCTIHRIQERLDAVDKMTRYCGKPLPTWLEKMILTLYAQMTEIRRYGEKKCRKILSPESEFSGPIKMWYDRIHAYLQLIRLSEGRTKNARNIYRFARRNHIEHPDKLTSEELEEGLQLARIRKKNLRKLAGGLRKTHLRECLLTAQQKQQENKVRAIKQRIQRESSKRVWYLIKRTVKEPKSPSVLKVQKIIEGEVHEYKEQEDVEQVIQQECEVRFTLAHSAPIMRTLLGERLRYLSDEEIARQIITGTYEIPDDLDPATSLILKEIGRMGVKLVNGEGEELEISPEDFIKFWKRVKEFTSSSMSGIHYGHYKAAAQDEFSSRLLAQQLTVIARSGVPPESWSVGLQVMLEKIAGVCLVDKLRAIQLYEADFNFYNQFIFGRVAMNKISENGLIPEELFSQKGSTAEDAKFDKTLTADLSRQSRQPMTIVSADAAYCYDRVNHVIMSLVWLTLLDGNISPIVVALTCLQTMKFFQRTGFGESKTYFGGRQLVKYIMGLGQGSRAAPPSWIQLSAVLVNVYKQLGLGSYLIDPITTESVYSMGAIYVDDADLYTSSEDLTNEVDLVVQTQNNVDQWNDLLKASGGALKPEKCFWYMLDYTCVDGVWYYIEHNDFELTVTSPDRSASTIEQKSVRESMKTLGVYDSPIGGNKGHLDYLKAKASDWVNKMSNGHLSSNVAWIAYRLQLWPGIRYGLGTLTNDIEEADKLFSEVEGRTLNILGVVRTATKGLRRLHTTFGGFGLLDLATEQLIGRVNLLLQHYHTPSVMSRKLDASIRYLQLQLGSNKNPLTLDYNQWGHLAPLSWGKMLWRSLNHFNVNIHMKYDTIPFPRQHDKLVMEILMSTGMSKKGLSSLNRCRGYLGVMFLSDMCTADGKYLEQFVFDPEENTTRSSLKFPREKPTTADWKKWCTFWVEHTLVGRRLQSDLGQWVNPTHRTWQWFYNADTKELLRVDNKKLHHYKLGSGRRTRSTIIFELTSTEDYGGQMLGKPTSVTSSFSDAMVTKQNEGPPLAAGPSITTDFWEFLYSWGGEWMWEGIEDDQSTKHDLTWIVDGMRADSLIWVTDGSYDKLRAPDLSGAGWIIFCTTSGKRLTGWFWECSVSASSYRAEMLGLCALHLLAQAISEFYNITRWKSTICCDNIKALEMSSYHRRRILPSASCSDIRRSFRAVKQAATGLFQYNHVSGHMDDFLLWHQLSLTQQLNCVCDTLAKGSIKKAMRQGYRGRPTQLLPREDVALIVRGNKLTDNISTPLRFHASKAEARRFYTMRKKKPWSKDCFNEVDWEHLDLAQKGKADMFKIWRSKQSSGFCGTRVQVGRYSGEQDPDEACPNCGQREIAEHLMLCPDQDRTRLLQDQVKDLQEWLEKDNRTEPELAYWVIKYILMRNSKPWAEMGEMSEQMLLLARGQDKIGWRRFTEGYVTKQFYKRQDFHLKMTSNRMNGSEWTKQFISKVIQITHSQWIFRNISLHDKTHGYLHKKNTEELSEEIHRLAELDPDDVPIESRFLLEVNLGELTKTHIENQAYWVTAVTAARTAKARQSARGGRAKRLRHKLLGKASSRKKMGIAEVERQIIRDRIRNQACGESKVRYEEENQTFLDRVVTKRPHASSWTRLMKSNKRLRKPD